MAEEWVEIKPQADEVAEFLEIANDFSNPLEILREAISNSIDAEATWVRVGFSVSEIEGAKTLLIEIEDNGAGMTREVISRDFWGLGYSPSRHNKEKIGEKGHGTKIYLRSERVVVKTQSKEGAYEALCDRPMRALTTERHHTPRFHEIPKYQERTGTYIRVEGYNDNERSSFVQDVVKDYLLWFTKLGSIERLFGVEKLAGFTLHLKCLDTEDYEPIPFGHLFPDPSPGIEALFEKHESDAADMFVKRYLWKARLEQLPEVTYEAVISVEGDQAKRNCNPMIRERIRGGARKYKVADRYGLWLCKDFIPIQRVNEWITGFGTGSNSFLLLHGFVNCQHLKLTANRGSIANTDPNVIDELRKDIQRHLQEVDTDLHKRGIFTLLQWQEESRTLEQEKADFQARRKSVTQRKVARLDGRLLLEPQNEAEFFGLFSTVYALRPDLFEFEPVDYNTSRGIDILARNKTRNPVAESTFWYVELKYHLRDSFNHGFGNLRWIICWDFHPSVKNDSEFRSIEEADVRRLEIHRDKSKQQTAYFLNNPGKAQKIQIIRFREFLKERLGIEFAPEPKS